MHSSNPLIGTPGRSVAVRLTSHWIEYLAVPICSALMETQPIVLFILLFGTRLFGEDALFPDALSITLMMLGLHWWLMWLRYKADKQETRQKLQNAQLPTPNTRLCFLGILLALAMYGLLHLQELTNSQFVTTSLILTGWSAFRAIYQSRDNLDNELLSVTFRVCFIIMLSALFLSLMASMGGETHFIEVVASALPLFFIAGVMGLSFIRLGAIQREREKQPGTAGKEAIGRWVTGLTVTWITVVVVSILLESAPLQMVSSLFNAGWSMLGMIGDAILFVFIIVMNAITYAVLFIVVFIYNLFPHQQTTTATTTPKLPPEPQGSPSITIPWGQMIFFVLLIVIISGIILLLRKLRNKSSVIVSDEEEEVREQLSRTDILKGQEKAKNNQQQERDVETLDPASMRIRYRDFLQAMAQKGDEIQRKANETPLEYQHRLLELVRKQDLLKDDGEQANAEFLAELTHAYAQERYGGRSIDSQRKETLRAYIPQFVRCVVVKETKPKSSGWSAEKARWGED